jgi:hypothetical protein
MEPAWRDHLSALERFKRWEAERLATQPHDYQRSLEWLSEAWDLAERLGSADPADRRERRLLELRETRRALERARLDP